jgi:hypothetical protein
VSSTVAQKSSQAPSSSKSYVLVTALSSEFRIPAIIQPSTIPDTQTEASYIGFYTMVVSLISLAGGTLRDTKLKRYLTRMNAGTNTPIDNFDNTMRKMKKEGYVVEIKENNGEEQTIDWIIGPRGKVEVGNAGVQGLVTQVYGDNAPEDLQKRIRSSLGVELKER